MIHSLRPPRCVSTGPEVVRLAGMAIERERERGVIHELLLQKVVLSRFGPELRARYGTHGTLSIVRCTGTGRTNERCSSAIAPRSPLQRLAVRLRHSRSNTSTEYSLPGAT